MVTDIEIVISPSIVVGIDITLIIVKNHASLENLDYAHSGHTGFASSEALNNGLAGKVDKTTDANIVYGTNLSGGYYKVPYSVNVVGYTLPQRDNDGAIHVGTPTENSHATPKSYVDGGLANLYRGTTFKEELIPDKFDNLMEFAKQVSGTTFMEDTLATELGTIVWCAATKAICGDTYYRKFLVNNDGTQAGVTTITPVFHKLYVGKTDNNLFKWSGSNLLEVSKSLSLGETSTTAYAGNKGKANAQAITELQNGKQDSLVSGTNIKTINGNNILGSGNLVITSSPLIAINRSSGNFSSDEINMLINVQAYLVFQNKIFMPSKYDSSAGKLMLFSAYASTNLNWLEINVSDGSYSVSSKPLNSTIYKHVITFPINRWYQQNSSSIYINKIILYTSKFTSIDDNWDLFDLFETDYFISGKIYYTDGTTQMSETLSYSIRGSSYASKKIVCTSGSNSNYWFPLTQNPINVLDDVSTIM